MSVDLTRLPADEEIVRRLGNTNPYAHGDAIQNVLDALNWYRCLALDYHGQLAIANAELIEVRNSAHHDRIFGEFRS